MLKNTPFLLTAFLFVASALAAGYWYRQTSRLTVRNHELAAAKRAAQDSLRSTRRLLKVDSLFHRGQYLAAAEMYDSLRGDSLAMIPDEALGLRARHGRRLIAWWRELDTLRLLNDRAPLRPPTALAGPSPTTVVNLPMERTRPSEYDSLTFALAKAEARIRSLEQRARRSPADGFLRFQSGKGNEIYYVGDVRDGQAHGRGAALYSTGSRYLGQWQANQKHGVGEFYWEDGARYVGEYQRDMRHGEGTYYFPGGEVYVGSWANDFREGEGIMYDEQGNILARGRWEDDELLE